MHHDFGPCFVTSPGGSTVIEETVLHIVNHDPKSNIAVECTFQKTRALWAECAPTVIAPGGTLDVPIRFAPREVKDYAFVIPFVVNGATKVPVNILGNGINARLELVNGSQRRTNFGLVNVGSSATRAVAIVNRSKRALPVELIEEGEYGSGALKDRCVSFTPKGEFVIAPRETVTLQLSFNPNKRISQFTEDLSIRYAGVTRKLMALSGKAQGTEIALDSDSLPFGLVVLDSQKIKKLTLENTGDLTITFQWQEATFGKHFTITPLSGKILPGNEASFDVTFKPKFADEDIRQDGITLTIPGIEPLKLTCTGGCVPPPAESTQTLEFKSLARKAQDKTVKIQNPTDKDWYLSPSLQGEDWKVPHEFKVPAKGAADLTVTYFPLTMTNKQKPPGTAGTAPAEPVDPAHKGQLFIALPDGSAQLYKLRGEAGAPECSGQVSVETAAKKPATVILKVKNWLADTQRLDVSVNLTDKPTPASFIVAANVTEIGPNGTKEFPLRYTFFHFPSFTYTLMLTTFLSAFRNLQVHLAHRGHLQGNHHLHQPRHRRVRVLRADGQDDHAGGAGDHRDRVARAPDRALHHHHRESSTQRRAGGDGQPGEACGLVVLRLPVHQGQRAYEAGGQRRRHLRGRVPSAQAHRAAHGAPAHDHHQGAGNVQVQGRGQGDAAAAQAGAALRRAARIDAVGVVHLPRVQPGQQQLRLLREEARVLYRAEQPDCGSCHWRLGRRGCPPECRV
jgi:hypothetical protein